MTSENGKIYIKVVACGPISGNMKDWDDGFHLAIRHICVYYCENSVSCIQVAYSDSSTSTVLSPMHGSVSTGDSFEEIYISPDDLIVFVSGFYSIFKDGNLQQRLRSLEFVTGNGKSYGPYGINASDRKYDSSYGTSYSFCFKTMSGVSGFHGSIHGCSLCSIGIYVQPQAFSVS